jgi:hypothetical protein
MPLHERSSRRVVVQLMMVGVKKSKSGTLPKSQLQFCGKARKHVPSCSNGLSRLLSLAAGPHLNM